MSFSYGQKVKFTEGDTGIEYDAEICGPILRIEGRRGGQQIKAGKAILGCVIERRDADGRLKPVKIEGKGLIAVETVRGERAEREAYTLRVDFGDNRFADISGVSPQGSNFNNHKKSFFTPIVEAAKATTKDAKPDEKKG